MADNVALALIGAGAIAEFAHLPAIRRRNDVDLCWLVDADEATASRQAVAWGAARWTTEYRRVLDDPSVDAVDICLPPALHARVAIESLAAGKHVLLEKPMALGLLEARTVRDTAKRSDRRFMVGENWYFASAITKVMAHLRSGAIGEPYLIRGDHESPFRIPPSMGDPGIGWLTSAGTHMLSASRRLLGEFASVFALSPQQAEVGRPRLEDDLILAAEFRPGLVGSFTFTSRSRHLGERHLRFAVFGTEGLLEFDVWSGTVVLSGHGVRVEEQDARTSPGYDEEIAHFLACIRDGSTPIPSADDQLRTVAVIDAAYRSLATGKRETVSTEDDGPS